MNFPYILFSLFCWHQYSSKHPLVCQISVSLCYLTQSSEPWNSNQRTLNAEHICRLLLWQVAVAWQQGELSNYWTTKQRVDPGVMDKAHSQEGNPGVMGRTHSCKATHEGSRLSRIIPLAWETLLFEGLSLQGSKSKAMSMLVSQSLSNSEITKML